MKRTKEKQAKGKYIGYQLAIFIKSLAERREFEQGIDYLLSSITNHGKTNYWGGMTTTQTEEFIKEWYKD